MFSLPSSSAAPELLELIRLSRAAGGDPDWVQGGGGNTSVKSADAAVRSASMWVKTSGTTLSEMDEARGWAELDLAAARAIVEDEAAAVAAMAPREREEAVLARLVKATRRPAGMRPSVESSLHAQLDRVVLHSHPVHLTAFLCARDSRSAWPDLLGELADATLYVPYVDPGFTLAANLRDELAARARAGLARPRIVLLENHGLFVAADSVDDCLALHERVAAAGRRWAGGRRVNPVRFEALRAEAGSGDAEYPICANDIAAFASATLSGRPHHDASEIAQLSRTKFARARVRGALLEGGAAPTLVREDDSPTALELMRDPSAWRRLADEGAFTPDQIVYCRTYPLVLDGPPEGWPGAVRAFREKHTIDPKAIVVPGLGLFHAARDVHELRVVAETHRLALTALLRGAKSGGPRFLDRRQASFIEEWEVEKYRASLVGGSARPLAGRIAWLAAAALERARVRLHELGATVVVGDVPMSVLLASFGGLDLVVVADPAAARSPRVAEARALMAAQGAGGEVVGPEDLAALTAGRRPTP
jgi:rhamnose utilization protein RhaD (predicted bifunctional aldolase and dehydrogenase)